MRGYAQLTLGQLRLFMRNRQMLFWTLFFPIFLMIMLGSFLGGGGGVSLNVVVIDHDQSDSSKAFIEAMKQYSVGKQKVVTLNQSLEEADALNQLKHGDQQMVVIVPQGYGKAVAAKTADLKSGTLGSVTVYYDDTNLVTQQIGVSIVNQVADGVSKSLVHYEPVVSVLAKGVQSLNLKYIDFLVPGIVAMMIMTNNLNGVSGQIASWRERGILRRMQSTPLNASAFVAAQITARLILNSAQALIVLLVGSVFFGTQVNGHWWLLILFVIIGTLAFMALGFIIAGLAKTPESAGPIAGFISFPMLFLGGVFFPIKNMPDFLQHIVKLLPIAHLTTALRQVMNVGADLSTLWSQLALLSGWMIVAFIISSFTFKWE